LTPFLPQDWALENYIFDTWRKVCLSYGFEEYQGPTLEYIDIYNKSGQDVGSSGKELYNFEDKGGRRIALRPELTPTVGRIVAANQNKLVKPIKWFSIGNFFRAEKPQRGRTREFWQLNADIFGTDSILSDFEIILLAVDIMLSFGSKENMFKVFINNRQFSDFYFKEVFKIESATIRDKLLKIIDAYPKNDEVWLDTELNKIDQLKNKNDEVRKYCNLTIEDLEEFKNNKGVQELVELFSLLKYAGIEKYCQYKSTMARGFDYYTGMVFEVFDQNPNNSRSMFGGGRYDDLLDIFNSPKMPAVGFAPGDVTARLFLESWDLIPQNIKPTPDCLVAVFSKETLKASIKTTSLLRSKNINAFLYPDPKTSIQNQLSYANKKGIPYVAIIGPDEVKSNTLIIKEMKSGEQKSYNYQKIKKFTFNLF